MSKFSFIHDAVTLCASYAYCLVGARSSDNYPRLVGPLGHKTILGSARIEPTVTVYIPTADTLAFRKPSDVMKPFLHLRQMTFHQTVKRRNIIILLSQNIARDTFVGSLMFYELGQSAG